MMEFFLHLVDILFIILQVLIAIYLTIPFFSLIIYAIINLFAIKNPFEKRAFLNERQYEFGIIITAHQETEFIFPLVDSLLKQTYNNFYVYVIADDCDTSGLIFNDKRIHILQSIPALHAKVKSIHYGIENFKRKHDIIVIFDADNLVHPLFLEIMNKYFQKGYKVVQSEFKPKNTDSNYARMDAIGDMFNFFIEREVRMCINLSATIWGSGVAFDYDLYKGIEYRDLLGGFDKKLQAHLVQHVDKIAFAADAILFDEKIASGKSLENQRIRWIHSYFKYFKESFQIFYGGIMNLNFNIAYFGFVLLRPPLFIVITCSMFFMLIDYFVHVQYFYIWLCILFSFLSSFVCIVLLKGKDFRFIKTLFFIPFFVFRQMAALLKIKKAKRSFIKTPHTKLVYIDDLVD